MLKATNQSVKNLFSASIELNDVLINNKNVLAILKGPIENMDAFLKLSTYKLLQKAMKINSSNLVLQRILDIETYEAYRELQEKFWRGRTTKNVVELLGILFMDKPSINNEPLFRRS